MPDELEFFRDERIYLVRKVDDNWYEGEVVSGERGLVPANLLRMCDFRVKDVRFFGFLRKSAMGKHPLLGCGEVP
jgi:hypothetical protein